MKIFKVWFTVRLGLIRLKVAAITAAVVANNATQNELVLGRSNFEGDVVIEAVPKTDNQVEQVRELEGLFLFEPKIRFAWPLTHTRTH